MNLMINFFYLTLHRFNIAIKSNRYVPQGKKFVGNEAGDNMGALMDEAKTMLEIGCYHENKCKASKYYLHYYSSSILYHSRHSNQVFERRLCFASDNTDKSYCLNFIHSPCFSTNRW